MIIGNPRNESYALSRVANTIGSIYTELNQYELALKYLMESSQLLEALSDTQSKSTVYYNISRVYLLTKDFTKSTFLFGQGYVGGQAKQ